jgi:hypothetical protein
VWSVRRPEFSPGDNSSGDAGVRESAVWHLRALVDSFIKALLGKLVPHEYLYFEDALEISDAQFYCLMNRASVLPGVKPVDD